MYVSSKWYYALNLHLGAHRNLRPEKASHCSHVHMYMLSLLLSALVERNGPCHYLHSMELSSTTAVPPSRQIIEQTGAG